jgi:hypothetical protein
VLHLDKPEHLVAGLIDREFHVVDADLPEARRLHERVHYLVMRDDLLRGLVKREARDRLSCVSALTPVPRPDCRQKLRRPNNRNLRFALGLFDNLGQREIQTEEKIATVVLRAPEMERIEQLVPVDFSFALIGPGNSLKFEKTLIFQRA